MIAPMIMTTEPAKMEPLRPHLSLTIGTRGRERIAPSEYAAAMIPLSEPAGCPKSAKDVSMTRISLVTSEAYNLSMMARSGGR
jgi:hypothetical protein